MKRSWQSVGILGWALLFSIGGVEAKKTIDCNILACFGSKILCPAKGGCCTNGRTYHAYKRPGGVDSCKSFTAVEFGAPKCKCQNWRVGNCGWNDLRQPDDHPWIPHWTCGWCSPKPYPSGPQFATNFNPAWKKSNGVNCPNPTHCAVGGDGDIHMEIDPRPVDDCRCPPGYKLPANINPKEHIGWKTFDCDAVPCQIPGSEVVADAQCQCRPEFSGRITWDPTSMSWTGNCQMTCKSLQDHAAKCTGGRIRIADSDRTLVTGPTDFQSTCCQMTCKSLQDNVNCSSGHTRKAGIDSMTVTSSGDFESTCCERTRNSGPGGDMRTTMQQILTVWLTAVGAMLLIKALFAPAGFMKYVVASATLALVWLALTWVPEEAMPELFVRLVERLIDKSL